MDMDTLTGIVPTFVRNQGTAIAEQARSAARAEGTYTRRFDRIHVVAPEVSDAIFGAIIQWLRQVAGFRVVDVDLTAGCTLDWTQADVPDSLAAQCRAAADQANVVPCVQTQITLALQRGQTADVRIRVPTHCPDGGDVAAKLRDAGLSWRQTEMEPDVFITDLTPLVSFTA